MPVYEIETPDGTFEIEGPEGFTADQAFQALQQEMPKFAPTQAADPFEQELEQARAAGVPVERGPIEDPSLDAGRLATEQRMQQPDTAEGRIDQFAALSRTVPGLGQTLFELAPHTQHELLLPGLGEQRQQQAQQLAEQQVDRQHIDSTKRAIAGVAGVAGEPGEQIVGGLAGGFMSMGELFTGDPASASVAIQQATRELAQEGELNETLANAMSSAAESTYKFAASGGPISPSAAAITFGADSAKQAWETAPDDMTEEQRRVYAYGMGVIEGGTTALLNSLGLGGLETVGQQQFRGVMSSLAKNIAAEELEELLVFGLQEEWSQLQGAAEDKTPEQVVQELKELVLATALGTGAMSASQAVGGPADTAAPLRTQPVGEARTVFKPRTPEQQQPDQPDRRQAEETRPPDQEQRKEDRRKPTREEQRAEISKLYEEGRAEEAEQLIGEIQEQARRDPKGTGLLSGLEFDSQLVGIQREVAETGQPRPVAVMDVANLGLSNTVRGHLGADADLQRVADAVLEVAGPEAAFRSGGDEMAVVFPPGTTQEQAQELMQQIEQAVGFDEVVPGASLFIAGEVGMVEPGKTIKDTLNEVDERAEAKKAEIKKRRGEPTSISKDEAARLAEQQKEETPDLDPDVADVTPAERQQQEDAPTVEQVAEAQNNERRSLANRGVDAMRKEMGKPQQILRTKRTWDQVEAEAVSQGIPERAVAIAQDTLKQPVGKRSWDDTTHAGMLLAYNQRLDQLTEVVERLEKMTDPAEIRIEAAHKAELENEIFLIQQAAGRDGAGTDSARALNIRRAYVRKEDYSLGAIKAEAVGATGKPLTDKQHKEFDDLDSKHRAKEKELGEAEADANKRQAEDEIGRVTGKRKGRGKKKPKKKKTPEELDAELAELDRSDEFYIAKVALNRADHPDYPKYADVIAAVKKLVPDTNSAIIDDNVIRYLTSLRDGTRKGLMSNLAKFKQIVGKRGRLNTRIDAIQNELETGWWAEKVPSGKDSVDEALALLTLHEKQLRTERELQKEIQELDDAIEAGKVLPEPTDEAAEEGHPFIEGLKERKKELQAEMRVVREIAKLKEQLESGIFEKPTRQEKAKNARLLRLEAERDLLRAEIKRRVGDFKATSLRKIGNLLDIPRGIMANFDESFVGIQGLVSSASRPIAVLPKTVKAMFMQSITRPKWRMAMNEIENHPQYNQFLEAGGQITDMDSPLTREEMQSELLEAAPIRLGKALRATAKGLQVPGLAVQGFGEAVGFFQRGFSLAGNVARFYTWVAMNKASGPHVPPAVAKSTAESVNTMTGRPRLGPKGSKREMAAYLSNHVLFSMRFWLSRIQLVTGYPLIKSAFRRDALGTARIAKEYGRAIASIALLMAMWDWWGGDDTGVELDPHSDAFLTMWWKDTDGKKHELDPTGGIGREASFWWQVLSGRRKTRSMHENEEAYDMAYPEFGKPGVREYLSRRVQGKLAPIPSYLVAAADRQEYMGQPFDPIAGARDRLIPLSAQDMKDAMKTDDPAAKVALLGLSFFGFRPMSIDPKESRRQYAEWLQEFSRRKHERERSQR